MAETRLSARQRGYTHQWDKARLRYLAEHPLCRMCGDEGWIASATIVDHIIPHKGDQVLMWNRENWQPLCKWHHDSVKQREDRGLIQVVGEDGWPV